MSSHSPPLHTLQLNAVLPCVAIAGDSWAQSSNLCLGIKQDGAGHESHCISFLVGISLLGNIYSSLVLDAADFL